MRLRKKYIVIVFAVIIVALVCSYMIASRQTRSATRLILLFPPTMHPYVVAEITVVAVSDDMQLDPGRDDLVEIALNPNSRVRLDFAETPQSEWTQTLSVRLVEGKATFMMVGDRFEMVVISAKWVDGRSPLKSLTTMRQIGVD